MDTKTHKKCIFLESEKLCWLQKYISFSNQRKIEKFCKYMQILQISVRHFEYLMICDFLSENNTAVTRTKVKIFWIFYKNRLIFTSDFALRVRSPTYPHITSLISNDVIYFEYVFITQNIKFYRNWSVRSRDIEVLVSNGNIFFKPEVDSFKTKKYIYFWNQTIVLIKKIYFVFKLEQNWEMLQKYANFANFGPPFFIFNELRFSSKTIQQRPLLN